MRLLKDFKKVLKDMSNSRKIKLSIVILAAFNFLLAQKSKIERIEIDSKQNGITINIYSDVKIQSSQITGWYNSSTSWSYITIYNAGGDVENLNESDIGDKITDIEIIRLKESMQLGIRSIISIEQFEFYEDPVDSSMTASLRYPIDRTLTYIDKKESQTSTRNNDIKTLLTKYKSIAVLLSTIALLKMIIS